MKILPLIKKDFPSLVSIKSPIPLVTDDKQDVCNAINKTFTDVIRIKY